MRKYSLLSQNLMISIYNSTPLFRYIVKKYPVMPPKMWSCPDTLKKYPANQRRMHCHLLATPVSLQHLYASRSRPNVVLNLVSTSAFLSSGT